MARRWAGSIHGDQALGAIALAPIKVALGEAFALSAAMARFQTFRASLGNAPETCGMSQTGASPA